MRCISKSMDPMFVIFIDTKGNIFEYTQNYKFVIFTNSKGNIFEYTQNYKSIFVLLSDNQVK